MIKNAKLWAISLSSLLILTACGGGGGDDGGVAVNQPTKPVATYKKPDVAKNLKIDGNIVLVGEKYGKTTKYEKSDDVDLLIVDGKRFYVSNIDDHLQKLETTQTKFYLFKDGVDYDESNTSDYLATGAQASVSYASYGAYVINPDDTTGLNKYRGFGVFYQGYLTPENAVPTSGVVHYVGGAGVFNEKKINAGEYSNSVWADVDLTANFDKKELTGTIKNDSIVAQSKFPEKSEIYAKIKGNTFAGTKNNVTTEGKFFGPKAESIGGTFHDKNQGVVGSFAADRKK